MVWNGARRSTVIAVDAMGGDHAPLEVLKGAVAAHRRGCHVVAVGDREIIGPELERLGAAIPVVHAAESIAMDEPITQALRRKEASLRVACELVNSDDAEAVVSCGNSAAIMAVALHCFGAHSGIDRPAFGSTLPCRDGGVFVLDIGANPVVKPSNLVQFALMGDVFVALSRGIESPRVALLSNGSEDSKGTKEIKEANQTLRKTGINFVGNVEGNHVFEGAVDVVVCDGFSGNVLLKGAEGVATEIFDLLRTEISRDLISKVAAAGLRPAFERLKRRLDYEEYGGAPVLGVNEVVINCHGRSRAKAVTNAILLAEQMAREHLVDRIGAALQPDSIESRGRKLRLAHALRLRHGEA